MELDAKEYNELLKWAKNLLTTKKIPNLTEVDLINEAYVKLVTSNKTLSQENLKKEARGVLYIESAIEFGNDRNYLEFGYGNPEYKQYSNFQDSYQCKRCKEIKSISEFHIEKNTKRGGYQRVASQCKPCAALLAKEYKKRPNRKKCVNKTVGINIYNQYGELQYKAISLIDAATYLGVREDQVRNIFKTGKRHKNIHRLN